MIATEIVLTVPGHPKPKGSMVCTRNPVHTLREAVDNTEWRKELTRWARKVTQRAGRAEPIVVEATSTLTRPKNHYGTGRNATRVKDSAPAWPTAGGTGDVDKLVRLVLDVLQDVDVLDNDVQVVEVISRKAYVDGPGVDALEHPGIRVRIYPQQALE